MPEGWDLTGSKHQKDPTYMLLIVRLLVVSAAGSVAILKGIGEIRDAGRGSRNCGREVWRVSCSMDCLRNLTAYHVGRARGRGGTVGR